jgi:two-component system LytT family response regulator
MGEPALLKTLIVDDEPVARRILREELELFDNVTVAGEAEDGITALAAIRDLRPDLVFLDLQMPGVSGFEVIRNLEKGSHVPLAVIVTAWDQHAVEAFESGAIDYLLKPVTQDRLAKTLERAAKICGSPAAAERHTRLQKIAESLYGGTARRIIAKSGQEYLLLSTDEVLAFEAERELVWIITATKRYLATETLKTLEEKLGSDRFRRIHRNALVNVDHIRKMSTLTSQRWLVTLSNRQELVVSKRQAKEVRGLLRM